MELARVIPNAHDVRPVGRLLVSRIKLPPLLMSMSPFLQFAILCVAYNPFHKELYSGSQDCLIKAWDAQTGQLLRKQSGHGGWVTDLVFVPELRLLFSCSIDHTIRVWSDKGKQAQVDTVY